MHREWWERTVGEAQGEEALARVAAALPDCEPETAPGPLDPL
ncbi:MAG: hypothetical protein ACTHXI_03415 [Halomonadaceae bacterium]